MEKTTDVYLTDVQVAKLTGRGLSTIRNDRFYGRGFPYIKFNRTVRYRLSDVHAYMEAHKVVPGEGSHETE